MTYLIDSDVFSELRRPAPDASVVQWFRDTPGDSLHTSVIVLGELRRWVERRRRRDAVAAQGVAQWLQTLTGDLDDRVLPVTRDVADRWGRLGIPDPVPDADGLIAATALVHDLTVVTRNTADFERTGVPTLNPFDQRPPS